MFFYILFPNLDQVLTHMSFLLNPYMRHFDIRYDAKQLSTSASASIGTYSYQRAHIERFFVLFLYRDPFHVFKLIKMLIYFYNLCFSHSPQTLL